MGWKITKRNRLLIVASVLLLLHVSIKLVRYLSSFNDWKNSIFTEFYVHSIIDSIIFIGIAAGLIYYCGMSQEKEFKEVLEKMENPDWEYFRLSDSPGEWVDSNGVKWRRTNGGGLFWLDGEEWKLS